MNKQTTQSLRRQVEALEPGETVIALPREVALGMLDKLDACHAEQERIDACLEDDKAQEIIRGLRSFIEKLERDRCPGSVAELRGQLKAARAETDRLRALKRTRSLEVCVAKAERDAVVAELRRHRGVRFPDHKPETSYVEVWSLCRKVWEQPRYHWIVRPQSTLVDGEYWRAYYPEAPEGWKAEV